MNRVISFIFMVMALSSSSIAQDGDKVMLCGEDACTVITCDQDWCNIYSCSGGQCNKVGTYPNPNPGGSGGNSETGSMSLGVASQSRDGSGSEIRNLKNGERILGPNKGVSCGQRRCAIKTCDELECSLIGFDAGQAIKLGTFENTDSVINAIAEDFKSNGKRDLDNQR